MRLRGVSIPGSALWSRPSASTCSKTARWDSRQDIRICTESYVRQASSQLSDYYCARGDPLYRARIWQLHRYGMDRGKLLAELTALQNTSFTSYFTERQHSYVSNIMKKRNYVKASLRARALLATFRPVTNSCKRSAQTTQAT
eukprot:4124920-Amphidinium_carterae.1